RIRPGKLLNMDRFQPWHELETQQAAEREGDRALAVGVHVLAIDLHLGAMMDDSLDHGCYLGRRRGFELRMNAQRVPLDMPIDHDAAPAVAHVPLRRQVLIPGAEVLGIRCARRRSVAPDCWIAGAQGAVRDDCDSLAHGVDGYISARQTISPRTSPDARSASYRRCGGGVQARPARALNARSVEHR